MIDFSKASDSPPFNIFHNKYLDALNANQQVVQAMSIASYNSSLNEVNSRFVNLKFVDIEKLIFFTNYNSPKSREFNSHNQVSASFFWSSINVQIRFQGKIKKTSNLFNKKYFLNRSKEKNALAISSKQSTEIDSYESVIDNYKDVLKSSNLKACPNYWGGYELTPYMVEFWEGHTNRLNKRIKYTLKNNEWVKTFLQP